MNYIEVLVYDLEGNCRGHAVLKNGPNKLQGVNLWSDEEKPDFDAHLDRLNEDVTIKAHWPREDDPEVQVLLRDSNWEPVDMIFSADVVDEENSFYVWKKDAAGNDTGEIDEDASVIATKGAWVAERQSDVGLRVRKALEIVARQRS